MARLSLSSLKHSLGLRSLRPLPHFLVLGTQKGGTTSLHRLLAQHPQVFLPACKEVHYFSLHDEQPLSWYAEHYDAAAARQLPATAMRVIDPEPALPMGAMQQWHKLAVALALVREKEARSGRRYSHILKLRSDFQHVQPRRILAELVAADGLICASDKVFGGRRELMLLFEGFYAAIAGWFDGQEDRYWPIHADQILRSDDSAKWYGMAFPRELVGQPATVEELRAVLSAGGEALAQALLRWRPPPGADLDGLSCRFFRGHPRFASEVCFARFLNLNAIPARSSPGMRGFLRSDRLAP